MMKNVFVKLVLLLVLLSEIGIVVAQNGGIANYWYFGNGAGVTFNTGLPVGIMGPVNAFEGSASISDPLGNFLFATDGIDVYGANSLQMPNGFGLNGNSSSTQSGVIVPKPGSTSQYYIFTAAAQAGVYGGFDGIAYSIVDMTLNGGMGDVTIKNVPLVNPAAEKITAVKHCNGIDYWMICHEWNTANFYAYQITPAGVNPPIISNVGSVYYSIGGAGGSNAESIGYLKASPDGNRLAAAIDWIPNNDIEVFDFDKLTGIVSNPVYIPSQGGAYGVSFSPDNLKLYVGFESGGLYQYDLTAANIAASVYTLDAGSTYGAVQLGPDGKIYGSPSGAMALDVVNNPNVLGVGCGYVSGAVSLNGGSCSFGLPNFPDNLSAPNFALGPDITLCGNTAVLNAGAGYASYSWSTGATVQTITINQPGVYWVEVITVCGNVLLDSINVYANAALFTIGNDTILCNGGTVFIDAGAGASSYSWSTGATGQSITVNTSGSYWVQKTIPCGMAIDTLNVTISPAMTTNLTLAPALCVGDLATLTATVVGGTAPLSYSLNGATFQGNNIFPVNAGNYTVYVLDAGTCMDTSNTVAVSIPTVITGSINATPILCNGDISTLTVTASGGTGALQYSMNGGAFQVSNTYNVGAGTYNISIQDANGCVVALNAFTITEPTAITGSISAGTVPCNGDQIPLTVTANGGTGILSYSLNGGAFQNGSTFTIGVGTYTVVIKDANNCTFTTNTLVITEPTAITATASAAAILCHDGTTTLNVVANGGTLPYQYGLNMHNGGTYQGGNSFVVGTGAYITTVQDANGCLVRTPTIVLNNPLALGIITSVGVLCYGETTDLTVSASGGTGIKEYSINGGAYQTGHHFSVIEGAYLVSVKDANGCIEDSMINIISSPPLDIQVVSIDSAYCNEANGQAEISVTGGNGNYTYTWLTYPKQYTESLTEVSEGNYTVWVKDIEGCKGQLSLNVPAIAPPAVSFMSQPDNLDEMIYEGETIQFFPTSSGVYTYSWNFGDGTTSNEMSPIHTYENEGYYGVTLIVYDKYNHCPVEQTLPYHIKSKCSIIFAPDAFSPNGDQFNETFYFMGKPVEFQATVFDRWGKVVFKFNSITDVWDGKNMPEGVYTYVYRTICENGEASTRAGTITLIR